MKNSFSYSGAVLWNSLPIELRQADSLIKFKTFTHGTRACKAGFILSFNTVAIFIDYLE